MYYSGAAITPETLYIRIIHCKQTANPEYTCMMVSQEGSTCLHSVCQDAYLLDVLKCLVTVGGKELIQATNKVSSKD
jgi:hypothetical protein